MTKKKRKQPITCSRCGYESNDNEEFVSLKMTFATVGRPTKVIRSRTAEYLCGECLQDDPHWNSQAYRTPYESAAKKAARAKSGATDPADTAKNESEEE